MRANWNRYQKWCVALSTGGITLGIFQGLSLVNFANVFTSFLATWLAALVSLLLGGDPTQSVLNRLLFA